MYFFNMKNIIQNIKAFNPVNPISYRQCLPSTWSLISGRIGRDGLIIYLISIQ